MDATTFRGDGWLAWEDEAGGTRALPTQPCASCASNIDALIEATPSGILIGEICLAQESNAVCHVAESHTAGGIYQHLIEGDTRTTSNGAKPIQILWERAWAFNGLKKVARGDTSGKARSPSTPTTTEPMDADAAIYGGLTSWSPLPRSN